MKPVDNSVPIWLDRTCNSSLEKLFSKLSGKKDAEMFGTYLPKGTNWLLTKIYANKKRKLQANECYLQLGDAIFAELTGRYVTHFSSQISIVHNLKQIYSDNALKFLGCRKDNFPDIQNEGIFQCVSYADKQSFPVFVIPAMADFYAAFYGIQPKKNEGFILANTSEIAGKVMAKQISVKNFVTVNVEGNTLVYGSTNTGGNVVNWFIRNIIDNRTEYEFLEILNREAESITPDSTPFFIPFIDGERAPVWNSSLTGAFYGLKSTHTSAHLYRAVLEGIAFCRRWQFESMPGNLPETIKICGGSTKNDLFNTIRSAVLKRTLLKSSESELAIAGTIRHTSRMAGFEKNFPVLKFEKIFSDLYLQKAYEKKYREFLKGLHYTLKINK